VAHLIGAFALVNFSVALFISTRHQILNVLWHGLDKAYVAHKWIGISAVVLTVCHIVLVQLAYQVELFSFLPSPSEGGPQPGFLSFVLFVILVATALVTKKMNFEISEVKKSEIDQALEDLENGNLIHYGTVEEFSNRIDKYFI
jgi:predicted ferric reductase